MSELAKAATQALETRVSEKESVGALDVHGVITSFGSGATETTENLEKESSVRVDSILFNASFD